MDIPHLEILLRLTIAHLLADFVFQTDKINSGKRKGFKSKYFYQHLSIVGVTAYVALADWTGWQIPVTITLLHGFIDWIKVRLGKDTLWLYAGDQLLHLFSIVLVWSWFTASPLTPLLAAGATVFNDRRVLVVIIAFLFITLPMGFLIGYLTKKWRQQITVDERLGGGDSDMADLKDAGKTIGVIERTLILIFILLELWEAIGFLLAAKSVFRFGDLKNNHERNKTEYILIGTLLSFTFSIILGIVTVYLLRMV